MAVTIEGQNDWYAAHLRHVLQEPNTYKFSDCALYNNSQDFDIMLKFGEHKIYAHKVVLRMWSPFFSNTFKSRFAVATNPVFLLDDQDDNFVAVSAMLAVYTAADKYDCPAVRRAARKLMNICLGGTTFPAPSGMKTVNFTRLALVFVSLISKICGPDAPQLADQSLYTGTVNLCVKLHPRLIYHAEYRTAFHKKALYDAISQEKMYQAHITYLEGKQGINRL
ncbi:hypothetical protein D6C84_09779 [Aureobasidium pullulans]|uniref:BTB domain-containing protein n=1 Tax=Aureobasidium pullulans TaxID=5580 RepID=A0A4S9X5K5_AURPU|nr:hypothetical protein D6C84_09779 [Aureobasidium pullulans]